MSETNVTPPPKKITQLCSYKILELTELIYGRRMVASEIDMDTHQKIRLDDWLEE